MTADRLARDVSNRTTSDRPSKPESRTTTPGSRPSSRLTIGPSPGRPSQTSGSCRAAPCCPVSPDLARQRVADLRRARLAEMPISSLSHPIWSASAVLLAVSHSGCP
jgi:hypothetical protein